MFHKMSCFENLISSIFLYSVQVNRVATYKELDSYFQKQSALFNVNLLVSVFKSGKLEKSWLFEGRKVEENLKTCSIQTEQSRILAVLFSTTETLWSKSKRKIVGYLYGRVLN